MESGTVVWAKLGTYPHWPGRVRTSANICSSETLLKVLSRDEIEEDIRKQLPSKQPANTELIW